MSKWHFAKPNVYPPGVTQLNFSYSEWNCLLISWDGSIFDDLAGFNDLKEYLFSLDDGPSSKTAGNRLHTPRSKK